MSWNRPTEPDKAIRIKKNSGSNRLRWILVGAFVVLSSVLAYILLSGDNVETEKTEKNGNRLIKETAPAVTNKPAKVSKRKWPKEWHVPDDWSKPYPPQAYWPDGRLKQYSRYVNVITNKFNRLYLSREDLIFPEGGPNVKIATLLAHDPGETVIGDWDVGKKFNEKFRESLKTPIVINDTDDEYAKELKKAVAETREDLKKRLDNGEDLRDLLNNTREEMRQLYLYREEIKAMVSKTRRENNGKFNSNDLKDLYNAANQMLKDRGITKPISLPEMLIRRMELREAEQAESHKSK